MRLFIAVDLDDGARAAIAAEQKRLLRAIGDSGGRSSVKAVRPEHMHLTLVFLGEVAEASAAQLTESVREPVAQAPFDLAFGGIGVFPPRGKPNVLRLGVSDGARE